MRILHIANYSWFQSSRKRSDNLARYYSMDRKITNGLIRNGHCVWDFSYRDAARYLSPLWHSKKWGAAKMNAYVLAVAKQFLPELILLGHCELLRPQTLAALRNMLPSCKIAQWWVDGFLPQFTQHSIPLLREKIPYLDAFFATNAPSYYAPILAPNIPPPPMYYLPSIIDSSIEIHRAFAREHYDYDIFFVGAPSPERAEHIHQLRILPKAKVGIFGDRSDNCLGGAKMHATMGASKIGASLDRIFHLQPNSYPMSHSDRLANIFGNGCLSLMPRTPGMDILYSDDEAAYFGSIDEMCEQASRFLLDDAARRRVAEAGWKRAHGSYNERRVARFIVEAADGGDFSERYEWLNQHD